MLASGNIPLWNQILKKYKWDKGSLENFKSEGGINSRITQYSCRSHSLLFLKNIMFSILQSMDRNDINLLSTIANRDLGGGNYIMYDGVKVDFDYLISLTEVLFLRNLLPKIKCIIEIGAGYGRTCHTILSMYPNIEQYNIIDLSTMLNFASMYLQKVSTEANFKKICFHKNTAIPHISCDLLINIDSMQKMPRNVVLDYLSYTNEVAVNFYCKNTIGKYDCSVLGLKDTCAKEVSAALSSGLITDTINIFAPNTLQEYQNNFLRLFSPAKGWFPVNHCMPMPWSHSYQVLYSKNEQNI